MSKINTKYSNLIENAVPLLGGADNISFFTHCVTRLRFIPKDHSRVDLDAIKELKGVVGAQWSGEQLQIIVGQEVGNIYKEINNKYHLADSVEDNSPSKKGFSVSSILDGISGTMGPLIPMLIGLGLIKILTILLTTFNVVSPDNNTYKILYYVGESGYYFLPILVGATAARKFGANMSLGMTVGAMLVFPGFIEAVGAGDAITFLGLPVYAGSYAYSIFPVLMGVYVLSVVEKTINKYTPELLKSILVPFLSILIMVPLMFIIIAPAGAYIGKYLTAIIMWFYGIGGFVSVAITAAIMPFIIMTGMHAAFTPFLIDSMSTYGYEPIIFTALFIANINQGVAALGVFFKSKNVELKSTAVSSAVTAMVAGVTEPAMYGINLKLKTPMIAAMIGSLVGGAIAGLFKCYAYAFAGSSALLGLPVYIGDKANNLTFMVISIIIGGIVTFIMTTILYKEN